MRLFRPNTTRVAFSHDFDATTSDINLGNLDTPHDVDAQTIMSYCRPDAAGEGNTGTLYSAVASGTQNGILFAIEHNAGTPRTHFNANSTGTAGAPKKIGSANVTYGVWGHYAATWDGSLSAANITLYAGRSGKDLTVSGSASTTDGTTAVSTPTSSNHHIGNREGADSTFNGLIAWVARWNRVLTLGELRLAQQQGPLAVPQGLLIVWANGKDYGPYSLNAASFTNLMKALAPPVTRLGLFDLSSYRDFGGGGGGGTTYYQTLSVSTTSIASLANAIAAVRSLVVSTSSVVSMLKQLYKTFSASTTSTASLVTMKVKLTTLSVATSSVVSMVKSAIKTLAVSAASAVGLTKLMSKTLSVSGSSVVSILATKVKLLTMSVSTASVVSMAKSARKILSAATTSVVSLAKTVLKTMSVAASSVVSLVTHLPGAIQTVSVTDISTKVTVNDKTGTVTVSTITNTVSVTQI